MARKLPLRITWDNSHGNAYWKDEISANAFEKEGMCLNFKHSMYPSKHDFNSPSSEGQEPVTVSCKKEVFRTMATLEYNPGRSEEYHKGKAFIYFTDENRNVVSHIDWREEYRDDLNQEVTTEWREEGGNIYQDEATCNWVLPIIHPETRNL